MMSSIITALSTERSEIFSFFKDINAMAIITHIAPNQIK
jgi:hypothetical protein